MIFQHTHEKVLDGTKTQTRRLVKPGHELRPVGIEPSGRWIYAVCDTQNSRVLAQKGGYRDVYREGHTYAVQPGRGQKSVARIRITSISYDDVREISKADALAEGFINAQDFLCTWCQMHDPAIMPQLYEQILRVQYQAAYALLKTRPAERYQAWALTFKVVSRA